MAELAAGESTETPAINNDAAFMELNNLKPSPAPEIGPGWTFIVKYRKSIYKKGSKACDKYYFTPKNKIRLRSKPEVYRFLSALKTSNGDETVAYAAMKSNKGNNNNKSNEKLVNSNGKAKNTSIWKKNRKRKSSGEAATAMTKPTKEIKTNAMENVSAKVQHSKLSESTNSIGYKRKEAESDFAKNALVEDTTWDWDDASQIDFRDVQRISVHDSGAREIVTEARINGTPVILTGHVGWANFALRWLRRKDDGNKREDVGTLLSQNEQNRKNARTGKEEKNQQKTGYYPGDGVVRMEISREYNVGTGEDEKSELKKNIDPTSSKSNATFIPDTAPVTRHRAQKDESHSVTNGTKNLLDLSYPKWSLDVEAMIEDIGDEEVPVARKNYNEDKPISDNILASKFLEAGWKVQKVEGVPLVPGKRRKSRKSILYLHQWQFPLSKEACKKLCHQSVPLPNRILGEDLLKYWDDGVKLDSPLQYLFMGNSDTMSKVHRDNGGLAISIAPITGKKECVLVHRDDGHACLYQNQASLDPDDIDLNAYPLLSHARIWKTTVKPGEILLMPHGTYHQCRNVTPCLSYSRFHLDVVNLRAFLHSMMDGDAPELDQDLVLWNSTRELIDIVDAATDEKRAVDEELIKAVDALRALRNIAKEVSRKLAVREIVKGKKPSAQVISSSVNIDGDSSMWQNLVDDVDMCLHEFRYRFNQKIPSFKPRRSIGKKLLALPSLPFRGKYKPNKNELTQGRNEPVIAFECPTERGFLALPKAPSEISPEDREKINDAIDSIVVGDDIMVNIEGRKCPARVKEVMTNSRVARVTFEDLPSLYDDFVPCDVLRTSSVGGSCLEEPPLEEIKPGKLFVCLIGKDEYRGIVQYLKTGRFFKATLDFGNGYSIDKNIGPGAILSLTPNQENIREKDYKGHDSRNIDKENEEENACRHIRFK